MKTDKKITVNDFLNCKTAIEMAVELINDMIDQIPEKPDYWCSCGQCERNIDRVDDVIEEVVKNKKGMDNE